jgi:uncharacterized RDD family membrane protein YckC
MREKAVWYYKKEEKEEGPVSHLELQAMLNAGEVLPTTPVWTESLNRWAPIAEIEHFNLSSLDEMGTVGMKRAVKTRLSEDEGVRPRPWVRFWARMIDYSLLLLLMILVSMHFRFFFAFLQPVIVLTVLFIWVFIETLLLISWGTTPGKWLLSITLRDEYQHRLKLSDALNRSFSVWWLGMGVGIPIVSFITMIVAAVKLSNTGTTSWDQRNGYQVSHGKIGLIRTLCAILYFSCYFCFMYWI